LCNLLHPQAYFKNGFLPAAILDLEIQPGFQEAVKIVIFPALYAALISQDAGSNQDPTPEGNLRNRIQWEAYNLPETQWLMTELKI
jgi:hypothetical protein